MQEVMNAMIIPSFLLFHFEEKEARMHQSLDLCIMFAPTLPSSSPQFIASVTTYCDVLGESDQVS
jgi:hypothetical protein